jgi:hypothetical protein
MQLRGRRAPAVPLASKRDQVRQDTSGLVSSSTIARPIATMSANAASISDPACSSSDADCHVLSPFADHNANAPRQCWVPVMASRVQLDDGQAGAPRRDNGTDLQVKFRHCHPSPISDTTISEIG